MCGQNNGGLGSLLSISEIIRQCTISEHDNDSHGFKVFDHQGFKV